MARNSGLMADISSNNSEYDAVAYANAGHVLIGIKATEGLHYVNPNHRAWVLHSHLNHVGVIHYHFGRPDLNTDPRTEAEAFLREALRNAGGRDYLVLDLERATPQGWQHDPAWSRAFDEYVQERSRFHTLLYISRSPLMTSDAWLTGDVKRVWLADYSATPDECPNGYTVVLRQFTDGILGPMPHSLAGVGRCDISIVRPPLLARTRVERPCQPC